MTFHAPNQYRLRKGPVAPAASLGAAATVGDGGLQGRGGAGMKRDAFTLPLAFPDELIIDNFAGGGGTSTGLEAAFGRPVDIAINHDPEALAMHAINHPHTLHLCESVWDVDPIAVTRNQPVGLVWLSPDCKHFSKAKGGTPVKKHIRGLAWVGMRWVAKTKPRVLMLENVEEFQTWGPLIVGPDGTQAANPLEVPRIPLTATAQVRMCGNSVSPPQAEALVRANFAHEAAWMKVA